MSAKKLDWREKKFIADAIRNAVNEPLVDMDAIAISVARSFGVTASTLKEPKPMFWIDQAARAAAITISLRFTNEPAMNILKYYNYGECVDFKRVIEKATARFDDLLDQILTESGMALPPRRNLKLERYKYRSRDKKATAILMRTLLALKEWDVDDVFTHPDDFAARINGARIGSLERIGLVESERGCNEKWYRLTAAGRWAIKQHEQGVPLAEIFAPLNPKKNTEQRVAA